MASELGICGVLQCGSSNRAGASGVTAQCVATSVCVAGRPPGGGRIAALPAIQQGPALPNRSTTDSWLREQHLAGGRTLCVLAVSGQLHVFFIVSGSQTVSRGRAPALLSAQPRCRAKLPHEGSSWLPGSLEKPLG